MRIDFSDLSPTQRYHVMTQVIVPRPIAWVLTDNGGEGSYNLAPYSYFNALSSDPPLVMISAGSKPTGEIKDTRHNIFERKNLVIHIPSVDQAKAVTDSAVTLPHGESELEKFDLSITAEEGWPLPRVCNAPIAMLCRYSEHHEIGPKKQAIIYCEVLDVYVRDGACVKDAKGRVKVDANVVQPLGRLGANEYATFGEAFSIE